MAEGDRRRPSAFRAEQRRSERFYPHRYEPEFRPPSTLEDALAFLEALHAQPHCRVLEPGPAHWRGFTDLCRQVNATGNLVPDTYLAALATEKGCEFVTADKDFARFPGLKWRHPLGE